MKKKLIALIVVLVAPLISTSISFAQTTINVTTVDELYSAVEQANVDGDTEIVLQDGTYDLTYTLIIEANNITVRSLSGVREDVILRGDAMSSKASVKKIFDVYANNFTVQDITMTRVGWHIIQIHGEFPYNAQALTVRNCVLSDAYQQILKASADSDNPSISSDDGVVEDTLFEYTAGIGPQYYIGGIDAHGTTNWTVRNNVFKDIISPRKGVAEFAIHFWNESANNTVESNLIINGDRGIGFGLDSRGNTGGVIRNNMIYHDANSGRFADVGIALSGSPNSEVYNNTVFLEHDFPWSIEYRFQETQDVYIANNITNKPIMSRDGGSGTVVSNATDAVEGWFRFTYLGDLHLAYEVNSVVDMGLIIPDLVNDYDDDSRPLGKGIDLGADEFVPGEPPPAVPPFAPRNLRIVEQHFLVCDSQEADVYQVEIDGQIIADNVQPDSSGQYGFIIDLDILGLADGDHTVRASAGNIEGWSDLSNSFEFRKKCSRHKCSYR